MLANEILKTLKADPAWQDPRPYLLALSGGADSLVLAHVLWQAGIPFIAAHFDHHLRPESSAEAGHVRKMMQSLGIECLIGSAQIAELAKEKKLSIEDAARQGRYAWLFEKAELHQCKAILTAHHADDQVETILMHFLRGAGFNGLEGMRIRQYLQNYSCEIPLLRPMLKVFKTEIEEYARAHKLSYVTDQSNFDNQYLRNYLRNELIPNVGNVLPDFRNNILRNAGLIAEQNLLLAKVEEAAWHDCLQSEKKGRIEFNKAAFLGLDPALQLSVFRHAMETLLGANYTPDLAHLYRLRELCHQESGKLEAGGGAWCVVNPDFISLTRADFKLTGYPFLARETKLDISQNFCQLSDTTWVSVEVISRESVLPEEFSDPAHAFLSMNVLSAPTVWSAAQLGQTWRPLGLSGSQKLSDTFINEKIPVEARTHYPILLSGGAVAWIPGVRIAEQFKLKTKEARVLHLSLHVSN